ncbi:hypothetical protein ASE35_04665 [Lysobacter sp. Root916]|uniref:DUF6438 domain-containing protein n=1 Tax=Lysobacter sp. Root916 TaxID=1736606 RepID=UPI00070D8B47|nr:hypothetical protein [Lysobacter sp. Root916]KRD39630.1 hypothetical protein ASE35_04665 [Lysobacter sp. Root916]
MRAIAVPLLLGLCACQPAESVEPEFRDDTHVVLKRSGCPGACTPYEVHIGPGGNAVFVGRDRNGKHPERNQDGDLVRAYALAYPHRRAMFDLIFSPRYAELEPVYSAGTGDGQTTTITITDRQGTRSVSRNGAACLRDSKQPGALKAIAAAGKPARWVPDVFCETVELIDSASCATYWSAELEAPDDPADPRLSPPWQCRPADHPH